MTVGHTVGTKGQIVVAKAIRDQLGVQPGWQVFQQVVGGHVELYFLPPRHRRSLRGILAPHIKRHITTDEEWEQARAAAAEAWAKDAEAFLTSPDAT